MRIAHIAVTTVVALLLILVMMTTTSCSTVVTARTLYPSVQLENMMLQATNTLRWLPMTPTERARSDDGLATLRDILDRVNTLGDSLEDLQERVGHIDNDPRALLGEVAVAYRTVHRAYSDYLERTGELPDARLVRLDRNAGRARARLLDAMRDDTPVEDITRVRSYMGLILRVVARFA